jgi:hypothetical protein
MWGKKGKTVSLAADALGVSAKAAKSSGLRAVAGSIWRVADYGITGYAAYEIISSFGGESTREEKLMAHQRMLKALMPDEIMLALSVQVKDVNAVCAAFRRGGSQLMSEDLDDDSLAGFSYIAFAEYIRKCPTGALRDPKEISEILTGEFSQMLESAGIIGSEEGGSLEDIKEFFEELELANAPIELIRRYDFLCFVMEQILESEGSLENDLGNTGDSTLTNKVGGSALLN